MNKLKYAVMLGAIASILLAVVGAKFYSSRYETEDLRPGLLPGSKYKIIRPLYLVAEYFSLDNKQVNRETARAYLELIHTYKTTWVAFQSEVPTGTIVTIIGRAPKIWYLPFSADRYFVRLDPDPSRELDVVLKINRGLEGSLDGLNPDLFSRQ